MSKNTHGDMGMVVRGNCESCDSFDFDGVAVYVMLMLNFTVLQLPCYL